MKIRRRLISHLRYSVRGRGTILLITGIYLGILATVILQNSIWKIRLLQYGRFNKVNNIIEDDRNIYSESFPEHTDTDIASIIKPKVKLFCWILTNDYHNVGSRAAAVEATWATRCTKHAFIIASDSNDTNYNTISAPFITVNVSDGRNQLWGKTRETLKYLYNRYLFEFDWFLKADDDTYVIIENLRFLLLSHDPIDPVYLGARFMPYVTQGYNAGGAGYVLSKEALRRFGQIAFNDERLCSTNHSGYEDVELGKCMENVGVVPADTRDKYGRHRFIPVLRDVYLPGSAGDKWKRKMELLKFYYYPLKQKANCCSELSISFHKVSPDLMLALEFLIYQLKLYGKSRAGAPWEFWGANFGQVRNHQDIIEISRKRSRLFRGNDDVIFRNGIPISSHTFPPLAGIKLEEH